MGRRRTGGRDSGEVSGRGLCRGLLLMLWLGGCRTTLCACGLCSTSSSFFDGLGQEAKVDGSQSLKDGGDTRLRDGDMCAEYLGSDEMCICSRRWS